MSRFETLALPFFVPADRPERFAKAFGAGADAAQPGFAGKLLIHPARVQPAREGLRPGPEELAWAERVVVAADGGATPVDGAMVDAPVQMRAEQIRRRASSGSPNQDARELADNNNGVNR